jgi:excisionase family DNA binding protein
MNNRFDSKNSPLGAAPYGFRRNGNNLVPDETEAPVIKLIYELFFRHQRKKTVARLLNEQGYRTRSGALFSDTSVERILRDSSVCGIYRTGQNGKSKQTSLKPIVSEELWKQANAVLSQEKKPLKKAVHLFAGLIFCACGGRMSVPSNSPKYVCQTCRRKIGIKDFEEIFCEQLKAFPFSATENESETLYDYWQHLTKDEKRIVVEQLVEQITLGERDIEIEFGIAPNSPELMAFGQQESEAGTKPQTENAASATTGVGKSEPAELNEPLLSETEAAKFLGISKMTLLRKRNSGEIKFFRVGFRVLYSKEKHLVPFLEKCERNAAGK